MISLSRRITLGIILAVVVKYIDGNQGTVHVHVSEFNSDSYNYTRDDSNCNFTCCIYGKCPCNSLKYALDNLHHNILINITTNVTFSIPLLAMGLNLENVSIIGHNSPTVHRKKGRHIRFTSWHNFTIQAIAWDGCATNNGKPALEMKYSSNITIQNYDSASEKGPSRHKLHIIIKTLICRYVTGPGKTSHICTTTEI